MQKIKFPFLLKRNVGRNIFLNWQKFYKIKQGKRNCWSEEGIWRRTQEKINAKDSGWKREEDKRRRMIHYEHTFDVLEKKGSYNFYLTEIYIWLHFCLPKKETTEYLTGIAEIPSFKKWWKKIIFKKSLRIYKCGDLYFEIRRKKRHSRDIEMGRKFPSNYEILEFIVHTEKTKKGPSFQKKPWLVLGTGIRKRDKRGFPDISEKIEKILPYLPAQLEIGGGASIESGVYPLHFLHGIYSVSDKKKKFIFNFSKDKFIHLLAENPLKSLENFGTMHKKIISSYPNIFYENLAFLHKKGFLVGPVITNNFDGFVRQAGLKELYVRCYDDNVNLKIKFDKNAKSLLVIGVHADRRHIQKLARNKGLKVIYIDTEGYRNENGSFSSYPMESPQNEDIVIRKSATEAIKELRKQAEQLDLAKISLKRFS